MFCAPAARLGCAQGMQGLPHNQGFTQTSCLGPHLQPCAWWYLQGLLHGQSETPCIPQNLHMNPLDLQGCPTDTMDNLQP